jgi:hypothetical protein
MSGKRDQGKKIKQMKLLFAKINQHPVAGT